MKPFDFENTTAEQPFKVPENFFEESTHRVFAAIEQEEKLKKRSVFFLEMRKWAAIFIVGLLGTTVFLYLPKDNSPEVSIEDYLTYQLQWQSIEYENVWNEKDILELEKSLEIDAMAMENYLSRQDVENLLLDIDNEY
jgi:hypothetical protein